MWCYGQPDRKVLAIGADDVIQRQWHECCDLLAEAVICFQMLVKN